MVLYLLGPKFTIGQSDNIHIRSLTHMTTRVLVGIDPGKSGGIAWTLLSGGTRTETGCTKMPETEGDILAFLDTLGKLGTERVLVMEEVGGYVGVNQPGSSAFVFGRNFGFLLGTAMALGFRVELVKPKKWMTHLSLGSAVHCASKTIWKNKLKAAAQRLYPNLTITLQTSDALLILEYGTQTTLHSA